MPHPVSKIMKQINFIITFSSICCHTIFFGANHLSVYQCNISFESSQSSVGLFLLPDCPLYLPLMSFTISSTKSSVFEGFCRTLKKKANLLKSKLMSSTTLAVIYLQLSRCHSFMGLEFFLLLFHSPRLTLPPPRLFLTLIFLIYQR